MKITIPILFLTLLSCSNAVNINDQNWTINEDFVREGCFNGKDCIPSIDSPRYSKINGNNIEFIDDNELVVGIWDGSEYVAYPHSILDWHEIVNDDGFVISYCPLTGSAIHFKSDIEFGVSGLLFNSNLIMYDRGTDSYWPQMLLESAAGKRQNDGLDIMPLLETNWANWKKLFPNSDVLNSKTGNSRNYDSYPYGSYKTCNTSACDDYIYFPIEFDDNSLPAKTRVLTLIDGTTSLAVKISSFNAPTILNKIINNVSYRLIISGRDNIAIAFKTNKNLSIREWDLSAGHIVIEETNTSNQWDILGQPINGSTNVNTLPAADSYIAYWFSVAAFFPDVEIIE